MDWEENLAAIIRCTDENLQRQFETMGDFASIDSIRGSSRRRMRMNDATSSNNSNNFFIRPLFQSNMESAQEWREKERSNQFAKEMHQEFETFDQEAYKKEEAKPIPSTMPFQMQTYDIPQMMEQVRMSIKLEVDARAAIAERQLSSIMQLCKSTSEELDRVRVEVCSNDRQLHSLEQTQSKIRQDLTTQKDIGFHLQSLCGKDESWRIQADNQLLELRQMVAALREQGNGIQISLQEKLSRAELLVHFNAAMEPIKAQVNANIQHQAQQIGEICRTASSSSLLIDSLTKKVSHQSETIEELRHEIQALKTHMVNMSRLDQAPLPPGLTKGQLNQQQSKEEAYKKHEIFGLIKEQVEQAFASKQGFLTEKVDMMEVSLNRKLEKAIDVSERSLRNEIENMRTKFITNTTTFETEITETKTKVSTQFSSLNDELKGCKERIEHLHTQFMTDPRFQNTQSRLNEILKELDSERSERKRMIESLQEETRQSRYNLTDELQKASHDQRTRLLTETQAFEFRMKEIERNMNNLSESLQRDQQRNSSSSTQVEDKIRHLDQRVNEYMYLMKYSSKGTLDNMMPIHPIERHSIHASMMNPSTTMTIPSEKPWPDNNGKVAMSTNLTKGIPDNQLPCHLPKEEVKVEGYSVATPPSPSLQASAEQGNATKIQQTLENSTRGALAEAEMAKMRVENRRRAELEHRQSFETASEKSRSSIPSLNESGANANSANSANIQQNISEKFPEVPMKSVPVPPSTVSSTPVATTVAINPPKELDTDALITKDLTCSSLMSKLFQNSQEIEAVTDDLVVRSSEVLQETLVSSPVEGSKRSLLGHRDSAPSISSLPVSPRPKLSRSHSIPLETSRIGCDMSSVVEHECSTCKEKVSLHELEQHEVECATKNGSINVKKCRHCLSDIPGPEIFDHELRCDKMLKQCPHCLRRQKVADLQDHINGCDCRLVPCPNDCGGKFLQRGLQKHLTMRCPKRQIGGSASSSSSSHDVQSIEAMVKATPASNEQSHKQECKFCDEEFGVAEIESHENICDWKPKRCQFCNMVIISRDLVRHETSCKNSSKSCPNCNETLSAATSYSHPSRCPKRPIKCIRCCEMFPADSIVAHSTNCKFAPYGVSSSATAAALNKPPPPPPYPPSGVSTTSQVGTPSNKEETEDKTARRSFVLSQLTKTPALPETLSTGAQDKQPKIGDEEGEDELIDDEEEEENKNLTLAQVVSEWNVENVCLWLREDVGVPDVVTKFEERQCNGQTLLELTESDLVNDYGIKSRSYRERIIGAIEAIKTSDESSDDEEEDERENEDQVERTHTADKNPPDHLQSSFSMLNRISKALELKKS